MHLSTVGRRATIVQSHAALGYDELIVAAPKAGDRKLLIDIGGGRVVLGKPGSGRSRAAVIQRHAAGQVDQVVIPVGKQVDLPLLIGVAGAGGPLIHIVGGRRRTFVIQVQTAGLRGESVDAAGGKQRGDRHYLDSVDLWVVGGADRELNVDLTAAVCRRGERFDDGHVLTAGGGEDIEVGQHLRAVDQDIELPVAHGGKICLREMQIDRVGRTRR